MAQALESWVELWGVVGSHPMTGPHVTSPFVELEMIL